METSRRLRSHRRNANVDHDLHVALATAESLQATIRHGDGKIVSLATVVCGTVALGADRAASVTAGLEASGTRAVGAVLAGAMIGGAAMAAWHLLFAIRPDVRGPRSMNRFGYPAIVRTEVPPSAVDANRRRVEAWMHVSTLADIAMRKHLRVRRSLPWVALELVAATLLLTVAVLLPYVFG